MLYLESNVYLVDGAENAAIYDINNGELYQINKEAKHLLNKVLNNAELLVNEDEKAFINNLIDIKILTKKFVEPHDIKDLREDVKIDFVWIEVTNMCNLKCVHCYDEALCQTGKIMSLSDFKYIIDELTIYGIRKIQIIGGEPFLLGKDLLIYLEYCIGKFEYIEIFTNGTLIKDEYLDFIKANNIKISLSIYSYDENQHNNVTKNPLSWQKTNTAIQKLKDNNISYRVKNVLMKNVEIGTRNTALYQLSQRKDIVRLTGRAGINLLSDELLQKKLITKENVAYKITEKLVKKCISGHNCFSRRLYFSVESEVYPCVMERRISHGTIKNTHLKEIIKDDIRCLSKDYIKQCKDCEFRYCCFDCRPDSNGKEILDKPWNCTYLPLEGRWINNLNEVIEEIGKGREDI